MINIVVRDGAVITNELNEHQFIDMVAAVHGPEKSLEEYIEVFNKEAHANGSTIRVHKDVVADPEPGSDEDLDQIEAELDKIATFVDPDQDPNPFLEKLAEAMEDDD